MCRPVLDLPGNEFRDENYDAQQQIYRDEALKTEKETFLKLNPSITEKKMRKKNEGYFNAFNDFLEFLYVIRKYDGVAIKAGQTLNIFEPIFGLFEENDGHPREKFTIRFTRHNDWEYSVFDTVSTEEGHQVSTRLPEMNAGYRLYDRAIECDDVIHLKP